MSIVFLFVFTTFVYFPSLEFVPSHIHCIPSFTRINVELRLYVIRKESESQLSVIQQIYELYMVWSSLIFYLSIVRSRAMATNTAPQWLKNTIILLCTYYVLLLRVYYTL